MSLSMVGLSSFVPQHFQFLFPFCRCCRCCGCICVICCRIITILCIVQSMLIPNTESTIITMHCNCNYTSAFWPFKTFHSSTSSTSNCSKWHTLGSLNWGKVKWKKIQTTKYYDVQRGRGTWMNLFSLFC